MEQRILILADIASPHIEKWVVALADKGFSIGIFSLNKSTRNWYSAHKTIEVLYEGPSTQAASSILYKLNYLSALPKLRNAIKRFNPDILHAHYASSYGLLGALSKFKPFIISVWGSDVYEFPLKSFIHKAILKFNLSRADKILSTSFVMKGELWKYTQKEIEVVAFGVNTSVFFPKNVKTEAENKIVHIGTIKAMEDIYGITTIIEAIELVKKCLPNVQLKTFLIGSGKKLNNYKALVSAKKMEDLFTFTGKIPYACISDYHNLLDILLNVSIVNESFGVSVIEGMACEKPVIVSNSPGLKEVIGNAGIVVEKGNVQQLAKALISLIESPELRLTMGKKARKHVLENYDFKNCLAQLIHIYEDLLTKNNPIHLSLTPHSLKEC